MTAAPNARNRLIAQIHVAKKQLGLDEASYRALLAAATGRDSLRDCTPAQLGAVVERLVQAGFKASFKGAPDGKKSARKVVRLIFGLWTELGRRGLIEHATRPALLAFCKRQTGVDHPDWLSNQQANTVVEALKAIRDRGVRS